MTGRFLPSVNFSKLFNLSFDTTKKMAVITLLSNLYFYSHIGTLYLQTRGLNYFQITSVWSVILITIFLAEVPTGIMADKIGRKNSVMIALLLQAIGEYLYFFSSSYSAFIAISILAGLGFAFASGASEALVFDSLPETNREDEMKKAQGLVGAFYQLAFFIAPIIGGMIVSELTLSKYLLAILITALAVSAGFLLSLTLKEPRKTYTHTEASPLAIFRSGFAEVKRNRRLQWLLAITVFTATFSNTLLSLYQPLFVSVSVPAFWIGAALSLGGLVAFFLQKYAYQIERKLGKRAFLIYSVAPGLLYILLALAPVPALMITLFVLTFAFLDARNPLLSAYKNEQIHSSNRATVLSLMNMFSMLYVAGMGLVIGKIADYSIPLAFITLGFLIIACSIILRTDKVIVVEKATPTPAL